MASDDPVHAQYEAYPYPPRDPRDEAKRLVTGSPSHLAEVVHFVFGGRFDPTRRLRALVAGGGTGDAAIMLAQQLADAGCADAEVTYVDWSRASRAIAEARAAARGLANLRFATGSLLALDALGLEALATGGFDYIDCCGVLHHLEDPDAGLASLAAALAPEGGMGLMVYAPLGRVGVYPVQALLRGLGTDGTPAERVALARRLLNQLPPTNWLKRNPFMTDHLVEGDPGLYDLLLHARDRAYSVDEVHDFVARAGLRLLGFTPPARYEPRHYITDPALLKRLDGLDARAAAAFAENLAGNIKSHAFYVVRSGNAVAPPAADSLDLVPVPANVELAQLARSIGGNGVVTATVDGLPFRMPVPRLTGALLARIDGRRSLREIHADLAARDPKLTEAAFLQQFQQLFANLHALGKLMLRRPA
ncbi:MAG: class I SAM-dependent methyltransferase [Alphaproteobacteria bacterium]|nr:class I SAM-dependent methyltransferase [Alphaproteobacteria bacterium]